MFLFDFPSMLCRSQISMCLTINITFKVVSENASALKSNTSNGQERSTVRLSLEREPSDNGSNGCTLLTEENRGGGGGGGNKGVVENGGGGRRTSRRAAITGANRTLRSKKRPLEWAVG